MNTYRGNEHEEKPTHNYEVNSRLQRCCSNPKGTVHSWIDVSEGDE
jgi:hypothetical protein